MRGLRPCEGTAHASFAEQGIETQTNEEPLSTARALGDPWSGEKIVEGGAQFGGLLADLFYVEVLGHRLNSNS
ncbi:MAG: hypothetical protein HY270_06460 [Deltaproteobacteria bacterium]|nr:hypothetical protein [Deltaproteobacteria bacterium]